MTHTRVSRLAFHWREDSLQLTETSQSLAPRVV